ncbi:MAG: hypothetical protein EOP11_03010 [Proteobacteria bacterium]|nr:MAG: hypothetical protein EOP11_03010 [Pseudomonadota bacterium]
MKLKLLLLSLLLATGPAFAKVDSALATGGLECEITESQGRKQERYNLRFQFPDTKGEFALRLYPLIVAGITANGLNIEGAAPNLAIQLLDNQMAQAETLEDLIVARSEGRTVVKLFAKLDERRLHNVLIDCRPEVELRGSL